MQRLKARLGYNGVLKTLWRLSRDPTPENAIVMPGLLKTTALTLLFTSGVLITQFYSGVIVTMTRKETFARNKALIEAKYGEIHK